jgi:tetrahydromethanopterin S-methyltransferase subunit G
MEEAVKIEMTQEDRVYQELIRKLREEFKEISAQMDEREQKINQTMAETSAIISRIKVMLNVEAAL